MGKTKKLSNFPSCSVYASWNNKKKLDIHYILYIPKYNTNLKNHQEKIIQHNFPGRICLELV